jgi:hypothetical protein
VAFRKALVGTALLASGAALLGSSTSGATDLELSLGAQGQYDSNIFHRETKVRDDFVVLGVPRIGLVDTEGKFTYEGAYSFPYQRSIKTNALKDFNQVADISADYHMSDRTQFSFSDRFSYLETLSNNFDSTPTIASDRVRQNELRNDANLGLVERFTPRLSNETDFFQEVYSTTQDNRSDNRSYALTSSLNYLLTERNTFGGGIQSSYLTFDESDEDPSSSSVFVGPFLAWTWRIDEQSRLRLSGGPTWVTTNTDQFQPTGGPVQLKSTESRWSGLGQVSLDRLWSPTLNSGVSYQRRQDTASGVSGAAILDAVALTNSWQFAETWMLATRADWTSRNSATKAQTQTSKLDTQRWGAGAVISKAITRHLSASLRYQYGKQRSQRNSAGGFSDFDDHIVTMGVNYSLDPIKVW